MRIGVLVLAAGRRAGGPETYEVELLRALSRCDKENHFIVYCLEPGAAESIGIRQSNFEFRILRGRFRAISLNVTLPLMLRRDRLDVFHATYVPPLWHRERLVQTMHGLVNFVHPEFFPRLIRWRLNFLMRRGIRRAKCVICVSGHSLRQAQEYFRLDPARLVLIGHGVSDEFRPMPPGEVGEELRGLGIHERYVLFAGKIQPGKNLTRLVEAFSVFLERTGQRFDLVLAGAVVSESTARLLAGAKLPNGRVLLTGHVSPRTLCALYCGADMLVFPSLFESFGLPVLEAMACHTPVIASTAGALPEVAGNAALLVNPHSVEEISGAMCKLAASPELRAELIRLGCERVREFSWEQCARETLEVYARTASMSH